MRRNDLSHLYLGVVEDESTRASQDESKYTTYDLGAYFERQMLTPFCQRVKAWAGSSDKVLSDSVDLRLKVLQDSTDCRLNELRRCTS